MTALARTLGTPQLVAYYVSSLVGAGLLATPPLTASIAGPACLVAWGLLVLVSYPFAQVFARISIAHPHSGGIAGFVERVLGARAGHCAGLLLAVAGIVLTSVLAIVAARRVQALAGGPIESVPVVLSIAAVTLAEEVRDPERTFARAIRWSAALVGALYLAVAAMTVLVLPRGAGTSDGTVLSALLQVAVGERAARAGDVVGIGVLMIATNAWALGGSRLLYALARDGALPAALGRLTPRTRVPRNALLALLAACAGVIGLASLCRLGLRELITLADATFLLVYLLCFVAALRHFRSGATRRLAWIALASTAAFMPFVVVITA